MSVHVLAYPWDHNLASMGNNSSEVVVMALGHPSTLCIYSVPHC